MNIAILDKVHPHFEERFLTKGWSVDWLYTESRETLKGIISSYDGIVLRSRIRLDEDFLKHAKNLKFIGRPGAGLENIDTTYCEQHNIKVFRSPEGNMDAVGEHVIGSLLMLMNHLKQADSEVRKGIWQREENRGYEIKGKTFAIIGYGYMGSALAKKLQGFECNIIAYDKYKNGFGNEYVKEVDMETIFQTADIVSLHTPLNQETINMVNDKWFSNFKKPIYFINTARGKSVVTKDLITHLKKGTVKGACLDVLEFESPNFQETSITHPEFDCLTQAKNIILTPHIAGWTYEAKEKMAKVLVEKIFNSYT